MLHPKHNRIDYGDQLIPPAGYELTQAIGTSYSLDLEALMILPVALFYAQKLDGNPQDLRYDMLDAITQSAEKITVFYQKGQLKVPKKYHHLMAYWEKGIQAITMPDAYSSFHPKVWVIRYESKSEAPRYKVLVTSRNLTFARDWDLAFATEGIVGTKPQMANQPLLDFLQYLSQQGGKPISPAFLEDLSRVKFDLPEKFTSLRFVPIGIPNPKTNKTYPNPITSVKQEWDNLLIISPFLDLATLDSIRKVSLKTPLLFSRKEALDAIDPKLLKRFECWQFSSLLEKVEFIAELEEESTNEEPRLQNLHAKLFVAISDAVPIWYLGSANCTAPAQGRNVEFMVKLEGELDPALKINGVCKSLTHSPENQMALFSKYTSSLETYLPDGQQDLELQLRKIRYDLSLLPLKGTATLLEGTPVYQLLIEIDARNLSLPPGFVVRLKPLPEERKEGAIVHPQQLNTITKFGGYSETLLSAFVQCSIEQEGSVLSQFLLPMEIDLPASRLNKIFSAIINSREKFLKYLSFLLSGDKTETINNLHRHPQPSATTSAQQQALFYGAPVFEKLLIAASRFPEKLQSIDQLVQRLKAETQDNAEPIITPEFESFWNIFQTFIKTSRR